jgi:predicted dinucleotide-binding enzyme
MSTLAFIGSGEMGSTVARLAVAGGLDVVLSNSRGPETLSGLVDQLGSRATTGLRRDDSGRSGRGPEVIVADMRSG